MKNIFYLLFLFSPVFFSSKILCSLEINDICRFKKNSFELEVYNKNGKLLYNRKLLISDNMQTLNWDKEAYVPYGYKIYYFSIANNDWGELDVGNKTEISLQGLKIYNNESYNYKFLLIVYNYKYSNIFIENIKPNNQTMSIMWNEDDYTPGSFRLVCAP